MEILPGATPSRFSSAHPDIYWPIGGAQRVLTKTFQLDRPVDVLDYETTE
jgi:hypothetical protein